MRKEEGIGMEPALAPPVSRSWSSSMEQEVGYREWNGGVGAEEISLDVKQSR